MRVFAVTGLGVLAGLTIGAGPAQASPATTQTDAKPGAGQTQQHRDRDGVVGYYRTLGACDLAGRVGEHFGRWDDYDCDLIRVGFRRGVWALEVERDDWWRRVGHGHGPAVRPQDFKGDGGGYGSKGNTKGNGAKGNGTKDNGADDGYGGKDKGTKNNGAKDNDAKNDDAKDNGTKNNGAGDGYGAKDNGTKNNGAKDDSAY
ncbi:hypothetical protein [Actinoplanes sp. M2I2]|uniref:hypothetical protein n=1 Tax=Actinoplanes sp. M2I2 TaxID=1734444 RepID=UPI002020B4B2|nr:hypothetical protein [Actinoplanes sp. M2I2]